MNLFNPFWTCWYWQPFSLLWQQAPEIHQLFCKVLSFASVKLLSSYFCQVSLNLSFVVLAESKTPYSPYSWPLWCGKTSCSISHLSLQIRVSGLLNFFLKQLFHFCDNFSCTSLYFLAVSSLRCRAQMHDVGEAKFNFSVLSVLYVVWYVLFKNFVVVYLKWPF